MLDYIDNFDFVGDCDVTVLLPLPGTEKCVVKKMIQRDNGIDTMSEDYVNRQVRVFEAFAEKFKYKIFYIDMGGDIESQQRQVMDYITTRQV